MRTPGLCGAAAKQRDLCQRPQQGRDQQHHQHRQNYESGRRDDNVEGRTSIRLARWGRTSRRISQRTDSRSGVTARGRTQGKHNSESASAYRRRPAISDTTGTAVAPTVGKAVARSGRPALAASGWCAQGWSRPASQSAASDTTGTAVTPSLGKAIAGSGRPALAASGWCAEGRSVAGRLG